MQSLFLKFSVVPMVFGVVVLLSASDVIAREYESNSANSYERHGQRGYQHDHRHDHRTHGHSYYHDSHGHYPRTAPPVYREAYPAPRVGYVWVPGYWDWRYDSWQWVVGNWVLERHGYRYEPHRWVHRGTHYFPQPGRWSRWSRSRDSDRDGVPNRYDRAPHNYYRR